MQPDDLLPHLPAGQTLQVLVYGPMYGTWGTEKFGSQPRFVDALKFHCMRVEILHERLKERRLETEILVEPTAFVTFK